ncbi:MAG TPA: MoxR family ATPase [Mucilaginibacter sp.]|nr:MoxR family ATPase [Mucilaginibacter sp.]
MQIESLQNALSKVIIGQEIILKKIFAALLTSGHILLEGVPGLAKTLMVKSIAQATDAKFSRIQFTPDLLPADVTGTLIYNQQSGGFSVRKGPIFGNFILADEINRAPAKVQSALLEAMQERQVTIGNETYQFDEPFMVLATQNPLEHEGTYPLPEAQIDRFMMKIIVDYPGETEEQRIIRSQIQEKPAALINPVITIKELLAARHEVRRITLDEKIEQYIVKLVFATRFPEKYGLNNLKSQIGYGASPRAGINLALAAKANAYMESRGFVLPEDIKAMCKPVFRHRIGLTYEAQADKISSDHIVEEILNKIQTP